MTSERVRECLSAYRVSVGRRGHLENEIVRLRREYELASRELAVDLAAPRAQVITDMPRGGGLPSSAVERAVIKAVGGFEDERMRALREAAERAERELEDVRMRCAFVEAWVEGLPTRQRFVVEHHLLMGEYWSIVGEAYAGRFGFEVSVITLKRLQRSGLKMIYSMAADVV